MTKPKSEEVLAEDEALAQHYAALNELVGTPESRSKHIKGNPWEYVLPQD